MPIFLSSRQSNSACQDACNAPSSARIDSAVTEKIAFFFSNSESKFRGIVLRVGVINIHKLSLSQLKYEKICALQVKKFASISMEEQIKPEKKAQKRPASPKNKGIMKNSVSLPNKMINHMNMPSLPKKIRVSFVTT